MTTTSCSKSLLFSPYSWRGVSFKNRLVLPPMCQYQATEDGYPTTYHLLHYGGKAMGGVGTVILEATPVTPEGRISGNDIGIWEDGQVPGLAKLADAIACYGSVPGIQLGHAGRKAWPGVQRAVAPSALAFAPERLTPEALTTEEVEELIKSFVKAAERAVKAGFKMLELHGAHGYLIHQFFSPLSNKRTDRFGGNTENRMRFSLEIAEGIRKVIPETTLLTIRTSGTEYAACGYTSVEMTTWLKALKEAGVDMIHVSAGGGSMVAPPVWPGYQLSYARKAREDSRLPVIGVGLLTPELAEFALQEGYCDFVAIGRGLLKNPNWAWDAAMTLEGVPLVPDNLRRFFIKE